MPNIRSIYILFVCCGILAATLVSPAWANSDQKAWAEFCEPWDDWDKSAPPYKIHGNTYYVGTCGISSILITTESGHVLIDAGTEEGANVVSANIESLGFNTDDVEILLHSHEHFDHVAGLAQLKAESGAELFTSPIAAPVLETGVVDPNDPQVGMHEPFPSVTVDKLVEDGELITLGDQSLTPIATPGHSPGAMSWAWHSCNSQGCVDVVYADSLSPVSSKAYRFSDNPDYVEAYVAGLEKVAELECDILITPHPSASKMVERLENGGLLGGMSCVEYTEAVLQRLNDRLERELDEG